MRKTTTLKKLINASENKTVVTYDNLTKAWESKSRLQIKALLSTTYLSKHSLVLTKKENALFFYSVLEKPRIIGKNFFIGRDSERIVAIMDNKVIVSNTFKDGIYNQQFLSMMNILWTEDLHPGLMRYLRRPTILKAVLTNRIYSEETLVKRIASQIYKMKNVQWKLLRDYLVKQESKHFGISLFDLNIYTKDINNSLKVILQCWEEGNYDYLRVIEDTIKNAIVLEKKVNLLWSPKRMNAEHLKMVIEISGLLLDETADTPIHDTVIENKDIKMLNTEKEVFVEGSSMRHCLFTNYLKSIKKKKYLAFHMELPERCTIGIRLNNGEPELDQAYRSGNRPLKESSTYEIIKDFIRSKINEISALMTFQEQDLPEAETELPF